MLYRDAGIREAWTRDGGISQGCPVSMVFIVALYLRWCECLEDMRRVQPQLYADNLKCISQNSEALLDAAPISNQYIRKVGQTAAPIQCVLLSTCADIRRTMTSRVIAGEDGRWKVELDVR